MHQSVKVVNQADVYFVIKQHQADDFVQQAHREYSKQDAMQFVVAFVGKQNNKKSNQNQ